MIFFRAVKVRQSFSLGLKTASRITLATEVGGLSNKDRKIYELRCKSNIVRRETLFEASIERYKIIILFPVLMHIRSLRTNIPTPALLSL